MKVGDWPKNKPGVLLQHESSCSARQLQQKWPLHDAFYFTPAAIHTHWLYIEWSIYFCTSLVAIVNNDHQVIIIGTHYYCERSLWISQTWLVRRFKSLYYINYTNAPFQMVKCIIISIVTVYTGSCGTFNIDKA